MPDIIEHFEKGTFEEQYWIPAHDERRQSSLFRKNKKFIRDKCGAPCWVCKGREDLEVHHIFEWAFWNALDKRKMTNTLNAIEFYDSDYVGEADDPDKLRREIDRLEQQEPIIDSPDDIRNLVVICMKHHRLRHTGIHTITFPTWLSMAGVPAEGGILSREQIISAAERVKKIDEELASMAENNYEPLTL